MKSTNRQAKGSAARTFVYTKEAAIELPNDKMCIKFGLEWLGRTCGARACSEKETAREERDVAWERKGRVRGVQNKRVAEESVHTTRLPFLKHPTFAVTSFDA
jgi:hypothetical protein